MPPSEICRFDGVHIALLFPVVVVIILRTFHSDLLHYYSYFVLHCR